jgi:hypothetical protein
MARWPHLADVAPYRRDIVAETSSPGIEPFAETTAWATGPNSY